MFSFRFLLVETNLHFVFLCCPSILSLLLLPVVDYVLPLLDQLGVRVFVCFFISSFLSFIFRFLLPFVTFAHGCTTGVITFFYRPHSFKPDLTCIHGNSVHYEHARTFHLNTRKFFVLLPVVSYHHYIYGKFSLL